MLRAPTLREAFLDMAVEQERRAARLTERADLTEHARQEAERLLAEARDLRRSAEIAGKF